MDNRFESRYR